MGYARGRSRIARATARSEKRSNSARLYVRKNSVSKSRQSTNDDNVNKHLLTGENQVFHGSKNSNSSQATQVNQCDPPPPQSDVEQTAGQKLGL